MQLYDTVPSRDFTRLDSNAWYAKRDDADGGISMKADALEADLFEQSLQMKRCKSWTDEKTKALLQRSLYVQLNPTGNNTSRWSL